MDGTKEAKDYARAWTLTKKDPSKARAVFEGLLAKAVDASRDFEAANALLGLGRLESFTSELDSSDARLRSAAAAFRRMGREDRLAWAMNYLACNQLSRGEYREAAETLSGALHIAESGADEEIHSIVLNNLGEVFRESGNHAEAAVYFTRQAEISERTGNREGIAFSSANMGQVLAGQARYDEAIPWLEKGLAGLEELGDQLAITDALKTLGVAFAGTGRMEEAEAALRKCIALAERKHELYYRSEAFVELGSLLLSLGRAHEARVMLRRGLAKAAQIKAERCRMKGLYALAAVEESSGRFKKAYALIKEANSIRSIIESQEIERSLKVRDFEIRLEAREREAGIYRTMYHRIAELSRTGQRVTASQTVEDIAVAVRDGLGELLRPDALAFCLWDAASATAEYRLAEDPGGVPPPRSVRLGEDRAGAAWRCLSRGEELSVSALGSDGVSNDLGFADRRKSLLACPLVSERAVMGGLFVLRDEAGAFAEQDADVLRALTAYVAIAVRNAFRSRDLERANNRLESLVVTDPLTGTGNRRALFRRLREEADRFRRYPDGPGYGILFVDLDNFKFYNDEFGHSAGDFILVEFAKLLRKELRTVDFLSRFGGDEFTLLLPETPLEGCGMLGRRVVSTLRAKAGFVEEIRALVGREAVIPPERLLSCSIGALHVGRHSDDPDELLQRADALLYEAKREGKDRLVSGEY